MNEKALKRELYKILREINVNGDEYIFLRTKKDEFGEDTKGTEYITMVNGLYHISKGYVTKSVSDGTVTHTKGEPMLLIPFEQSEKLKNGDFFKWNQNKYVITEKNDIQNYGIVCNVSLELVLDGNN